MEAYWSAYTRSEGEFPGDCFAEAHKGGCRQLIIGVESGNDRILKLMQKGTSKNSLLKYLEASSGAGLWNHGFFMFGFPTETTEEAMETMEFARSLRRNGFIHSLTSSGFCLCTHTPVYENPEKFRIENIELSSGNVGFECTYQPKEGIAQDEAMRFERKFNSEFPLKMDLPTILTLLVRYDAGQLRKELEEL